MENIISSRGFNLGGISEIRVAPIEWITNLPDAEALNGSITVADAFIADKGWVTISPEHDATEMNILAKQGRSGAFFEQQVETIVNLIDLEKLLAFKDAMYRRLAVYLKDNNGLIIIIGSKYTGASLSYDVITNPAAEGKTFFKLKITYETENGAMVYAP